MRFTPLPATFHTQNRATLAATLPDDSIVVIDTADTLARPGDFEYPFRPDSDFYYLTGIDEPQAVLVLVPGHANAAARELLFLSGTDQHTGLWEGDRLTEAQATERSGIKTILQLTELDDTLDRLFRTYTSVYTNARPGLTSAATSPSLRRTQHLRDQLPHHQFHSLIPQLSKQRLIKAECEIEQIRRAIALTADGLAAARRLLGTSFTPETPEYAIEAELAAAYLRGGATGIGHSFMPIVAGGRNAATIHYMKNHARLSSDDAVLIDTGAEYGYYAADISRTYPVGEAFTPRQQAVYDAVRRVQQAGITLHKPGTTILEIDQRMCELLIQELVGLKLLSAADAKRPERAQATLREYYPHLSHHLGLDVHDTGSARTILEPGMVVTCEPGLYLPKEGIGVRLEDDILITDTGHEVLSAAIPYA